MVKLTGVALHCLLLKIIVSFSAKTIVKSILQRTEEIYSQKILLAILLDPDRVGIKIFDGVYLPTLYKTARFR
jgi:hypothetical protein